MQAAVDSQERLASSATAAMQAFSNQSRSAAWFAANQNSSIVISSDADGFSQRLHGWRAANQIHQVTIEKLTSQLFIFADQLAAF